VIDRRLVVDGVSDYARALADSLATEQRPAVITMRGGMSIDESWLADPAATGDHRLHRRSGRLETALQRLRHQPSGGVDSRRVARKRCALRRR
jgi:hypothetical protein